jgi:hypothetical protein
MNVTRVFAVLRSDVCQYVRLVNIGANHESIGSDQLVISGFAVFGFLAECVQTSQTHARHSFSCSSLDVPASGPFWKSVSLRNIESWADWPSNVEWRVLSHDDWKMNRT